MGTARPLARLERNERIEAETQRIVDLYRELDSAEAVAEALGVRPHRVRLRMREADISPVILRIERTVHVFNELECVIATACRLGVGVGTVKKRLQSGVMLGLLDEVPEQARQQPRLVAETGDGAGGDGRRSGRRLDLEREAETVALYAELRSLRAVGARLGLTQEGVRQRLLNAGAALERIPRLTEEERQRAVDLYAETLSVPTVARMLGRSTATIRNALGAEGVEVARGAWHQLHRDPRRQRKVGEARIMKQLYDRLGSECAVARMLGVSQALVSARLRLIGAAPGRGRRVPLGPRDPELAAKVVAAFRDGASGREAALRHGVNPHTALRWIRAAGYDTSRRAPRERRTDVVAVAEQSALPAA